MREHVEDFLQKSMISARSRRVFNGGDVTSNGGVVLLRQADRRLDLTAAVARGLADDRQRGKVRHRFVDMLRQRVLGIALGYEDLNDHDALRHDLAVQTAAERDGVLASAPTLCRFENRAERVPGQAGPGASTGFWSRPISPPSRRRPRRSCSTSTPPTTRCTAALLPRLLRSLLLPAALRLRR